MAAERPNEAQADALNNHYMLRGHTVTAQYMRPDGRLLVTLNTGRRFIVDHNGTPYCYD